MSRNFKKLHNNIKSLSQNFKEFFVTFSILQIVSFDDCCKAPYYTSSTNGSPKHFDTLTGMPGSHFVPAKLNSRTSARISMINIRIPYVVPRGPGEQVLSTVENRG
jgi:hypothetical protein